MYNTNKKIWDTEAEVVDKLSTCSYLLKTNDNVFYRRNRVHLKPKVFCKETHTTHKDESSVSLRRSDRIRKQPKRLSYFH